MTRGSRAHPRLVVPLIAVFAIGCGAVASPAGSQPAQQAPSSAATGAGLSSAPIRASPPVGPTSSSSVASSADDGGVTIDHSLLGVLPTHIEGNPVTETPEAETSDSNDPSIARDVARLAVGFVADSTGSNWAVATVSALRPGRWGDAFFRDWRDTYDEGACGQAGGIAGHAESTITGRPVWIGTCGSGLHTYHAHLDQGDVLVSISALGDERFGERLIADLR